MGQCENSKGSYVCTWIPTRELTMATASKSLARLLISVAWPPLPELKGQDVNSALIRGLTHSRSLIIFLRNECPGFCS